MSLPDTFFLHVKSLSTYHDASNEFVLVTASKTASAWTITRADAVESSTPWVVSRSRVEMATLPSHLKKHRVYCRLGSAYGHKHVMPYGSHLTITDPSTNTVYPVIYIAAPGALIGAYATTSNRKIAWGAAPPAPPFALPPSFFLLAGQGGPYVLVDTAFIESENAWTLTLRPPATAVTWTLSTWNNTPIGPKYLGETSIQTTPGTNVPVKFHAYHIKTGGAPPLKASNGTDSVPVWAILGITNAEMRKLLLPTADGTEAALATNAVVTSPVPAPSVIHKVNPNRPASLAPSIAKRLVELAQLKKEMCPVTADTFVTGETDVMPCGHLFRHEALVECFKTAPRACPLCRAPGVPTCV